MTVFWNVIELLASIFENFIVMWVMGRFLNYRYAGLKKALSFVFFISLSTICTTLYNQLVIFEGAYVFLTIFCFILFGVFSLNGRFLIKILIPIMACCVIFLINISVSFILTSTFDINDQVFLMNNNELRLLALFLTKFLFAVVAVLAVKVSGRTSFELKMPELLTSVVVFVTTMFIGFNAVELQIENPHQDELTINLIFSIIFINIFILYMFRVMSNSHERELENSLLRTQLNEQKSMMEDVGGISTKIKQAEHDIKHHILTALTLLENNQSKEAQMYLKKLYSNYEANVFRYLTIDNLVINGILNFKISRCQKNKIDIKCDIRGDFAPFDEIDLCVLLCNLLDNAIEASLKSQTRRIRLTIKNNNGYLCFLVKNHIDKSVLTENKDLKTTKSNVKKHGIGIYSINQIVEKYDGILTFLEEGEYFIADAWLKIKSRDINEILSDEIELMKKH
jgi:signal transduction histidine kinase